MKKSTLAVSFVIASLIMLAAAVFPKDSKVINKSGLDVIKEKTFDISPNKDLYLETDEGDIKVETWEQSQVYIKILGNEKAKEKMRFDFSKDDSKVQVKAKREGSGFWGNMFSSGIRVRFEVKVPKNFNINIHTSGGNIGVDDLTGENLLRTSGGNIALNHISGKIDAKTSGGNFAIKDISGPTQISTSGGNISATNFTGDFDASTSGGNISLKGSNSKIDASTSGGSIYTEYSGEFKGIRLESSGGSITVKVPNNINAYADLNTSGGSVSCALTASNIEKSSNSSFKAKLNNGGQELRVRTSGGDIRLESN